MPSTVTHAYFVMDLYDRLDKQKQMLLEPYKDQLKIFAQGPDVFYFYNILSFKEGASIRNLGYLMHNQKTQNFFVNLVDYIRIKRLENNPEIIAFLYGMISHYVLDMIIHPFIIYKTENHNRKKRSSYKYFGRHNSMETYIDAYFMQIRGKTKPNSFKPHVFCFPRLTISHNLIHLIDDVFKRTFNMPNVGSKYELSIKQMKYIYHLFRYDRTGLKKAIYKIFDKIPMMIKPSSLSYNIKLDNTDYYLNINKDYWRDPLDEKDISNDSFIELYAYALYRTIEIIDEVDKVLLRKKKIKDLNDIFPNLSYEKGHHCKL